MRGDRKVGVVRIIFFHVDTLILIVGFFLESADLDGKVKRDLAELELRCDFLDATLIFINRRSENPVPLFFAFVAPPYLSQLITLAIINPPLYVQRSRRANFKVA